MNSFSEEAKQEKWGGNWIWSGLWPLTSKAQVCGPSRHGNVCEQVNNLKIFSVLQTKTMALHCDVANGVSSTPRTHSPLKQRWEHVGNILNSITIESSLNILECFRPKCSQANSASSEDLEVRMIWWSELPTWLIYFWTGNLCSGFSTFKLDFSPLNGRFLIDQIYRPYFWLVGKTTHGLDVVTLKQCRSE